jgi:tetratricopeptide (TPR) repeat protein
MSSLSQTPEPFHDPDKPACASTDEELPDRLAILILFGFSVLLYVATTGFDFVVDDNLLLDRNPYVLSFHYLKEIFTRDFWAFFGARGESGYYRPIIMLTLLAERRLFGFQPAAYHLVNVFLNALVVILVYKLGRRLWPQGKGPFWAGMLYAALPLHADSVTPVSGISDVECALFMLLAALVYIGPPQRRGQPSRLSPWTSAFLFALAVLSKEVALALPVLLIFYEHFLRPSAPLPWLVRLKRYAPLLLFAGSYVALRVVILHGIGRPEVVFDLGLFQTVLSGLAMLGLYIFKLVWPMHLTAFMTFNPAKHWYDVYVLLGAVGLLLAAAAFRTCWRRERAVSFAIFWFFITLGPVLNVRWLGKSPYAERYLYVPSAAACWLAGQGLARLILRARDRKRAAWVAASALPIVLVALGATRIAFRLPEWRNNFTLALATVREDPASGTYHVYIGNAYRERGDRGLARQEYVSAIALDPSLTEAYLNLAGVMMDDNAVGAARLLLNRAVQTNPRFPEAYYAWGVIEMGQHQVEQARKLFERAVALNPAYCDALNNLGVLSVEEGNLEQAQEYFSRAVQADPTSLDAHMNLGDLWVRRGQYAQAESEFRRSLQLAPSNESPYLALASLEEKQGNQQQALETYRRLVQIQPQSATALFRLGVLALKVGDLDEARQAFEATAKIRPNSALVHAQLGMAYLAAGDRARAISEIQNALRLNSSDETVRAAARKLDLGMPR